MYRDGHTAELESLRTEVHRKEAARAELLRERAALRAELERLKEGVEPDPLLDDHAPYRRMRLALAALASVASVALCFLLREVLARAVAEPLLSMQGLRNFGWHVVHGRGLLGLGATGFFLIVVLPWVALPLIGRRGLSRDRRWGWLAAVAGAALFIPTPLAPLSAFVLTVLLSKRVRAVYFPASSATGN
jgi:hypothetical protein